MEELEKAFYALVGPHVGGILGAFVLVLILIPYMYRAWETWLDARSGKRYAEYEKSRFEILKLRYEIEALRKEHELPELPEHEQYAARKPAALPPPLLIHPATVVGAPLPAATAAPAPPPLPAITPWQRGFLVFRLVAFYLLTVITSLGAFVALVGGVIGKHEYTAGGTSFVIFLGLTLALFAAIRRSSRQLQIKVGTPLRGAP